jgi:FtsP/CotA-like multicopper oxidase with cupredoxin domain
MRKNESLLVSFVAAALAIVGLLVASIALGTKSSGAASSGGEATTVDVTLKEFAMTPTHLMASPGKVTFRVTNNGTMAHDFEVVGQGKTKLLNAGEAATLTLELPAGSYKVRCTVAGHEASGMVGDIMVQEGAGATPATPAADEHPSNEEMDAQMLKVAQRFPEKTAGKGGEILEPKILPDGTKEFSLTAKIVDWEIEKGKVVKAWTYNGTVPGPEIHVNVGDKVRIVHKNELPESTSMHFHGIRVPNIYDGVDPYTQPPILPGETWIAEFTALEPSVGMYHSHHDAQIQIPNGMAGGFFIGEMPIPSELRNINITKKITMWLNDSGTIGLSLNGKSFPATEPYVVNQGDGVLVTYMNEGLMAHPMHMHQPHGWVIAKDGKPLASPYMQDTINVAPGERYTVLYQALDKGVWAWHCHILTHAETPQGMTGMVTALIVQ